MNDKHFYKDLKTRKESLAEVFKQENFCEIPAEWSVIIADVKNSTGAVNAGRHNDVNLVAASCLVVALNIAKAAHIQIPFFFTGDGGTVFVPSEILQDVLAGLKIHNNNSIENFGLELHIGHLPVKDIYEAGHFISIAKVQFGKGFHKPIIIGDGLIYAEKLIKQSNSDTNVKQEDPSLLDMEGLECRWDKIKPPAQQNEIVCYIIEAVNPADQMEVYRKAVEKMDSIYGSLENRNPLSLDRLKLLLSVNKIKKEMMARFGKWKQNYVIATFLKTFVGQLYFKFNWKINNLRGQEYLKQVILNSDILTIDGRINTIITGMADKRIAFIEYLNKEEAAGKLVYGHFISKESVMTCYIENRDTNHIHFVDGADGGYTEASKELKMKLSR